MQVPPMHPHIYSNGHICLGEFIPPDFLDVLLFIDGWML